MITFDEVFSRNGLTTYVTGGKRLIKIIQYTEHKQAEWSNTIHRSRFRISAHTFKGFRIQDETGKPLGHAKKYDDALRKAAWHANRKGK